MTDTIPQASGTIPQTDGVDFLDSEGRRYTVHDTPAIMSTDKSWRMPVGFSERLVSSEELRDAQRAFLQGTVDDDQRALIDACLSWVIAHAAAGQH